MSKKSMVVLGAAGKCVLALQTFPYSIQIENAYKRVFILPLSIDIIDWAQILTVYLIHLFEICYN